MCMYVCMYASTYAGFFFHIDYLVARSNASIGIFQAVVLFVRLGQGLLVRSS
jgi:hypothetical protein